MEYSKTMTATVYLFKGDSVLLHRHKKFNLLFPSVGHIEKNELPEEAARREVLEESGIQDIAFIDAATTSVNEVMPGIGESKAFYWMSKEEILNDNEIIPHIKNVALMLLLSFRHIRNIQFVSSAV